jgi:membrane fusion protein (multidrug efflux system)
VLVALLGFIAAIAVLALVPGCSEKSSGAVAPPPAPEVLVLEARPEDVPLFTETVAVVEGMVNAEIRARVPGYVDSQDYQDGTFVKKGQRLFSIDPALTRASITRATGDLDLAQATLAKARLDMQRLTPLAAVGTASQQELDNARAAVQIAEAQVTGAQGTLETAKANLGYTQVLSPIDGLAGIAKVRMGTLVGQGEATLLTTVSQIDPVRVSFAISEQAYLANAKRYRQLEERRKTADAAQLELLLADGSIYPLRGRLSLVDRQIDSSTGTITLQALFANPERILRPGLFGKIREQREVKRGAFLVPQRAVSELQGTYQLVIIDAGNKARLRPVSVGERLGSRWIIERGLEAGDRVVIEGLQKVRPGITVKPKLAAARVAADR